MTPLDRGQLGVMLLRAAVGALAFGAAAVAAVLILRVAVPTLPIAPLLAPLLLVIAYAAIVSPARRFRAWGYALDADELRVAHGVWTRIETHVPLARVQHVDVSQGPVERAFGVCRLILHTAGTANSRVALPGLGRTTAEGIRDEVRARIRADEA